MKQKGHKPKEPLGPSWGPLVALSSCPGRNTLGCRSLRTDSTEPIWLKPGARSFIEAGYRDVNRSQHMARKYAVPRTTAHTGFMPYDRVKYREDAIKGNTQVKKLLTLRGTVDADVHWRQRPSSVKVLWDGQKNIQAIHYTYLEKVSD